VVELFCDVAATQLGRRWIEFSIPKFMTQISQFCNIGRTRSEQSFSADCIWVDPALVGLSFVLVRPDGFVAWASEKTPDLDEAAQAASRWFGEPRESR
jgi:hypothetical protein